MMFLAAVGRPHDRPNRAAFSGLVSICPFVEMVVARTWSQNKEVGTAFLKLMPTESNIRKYFVLDRVFPNGIKAFERSKMEHGLSNGGGKALSCSLDTS